MDCLPQDLVTLITQLAARQPTPGGGAAAAVAAALGLACGAMAARYTTGAKYPLISAEAEALAQELESSARACLGLADADAEAYAAVRTAMSGKDPKTRAAAEIYAASIPANLLAACAHCATKLAAFLPRCNPHLVSDINVALHLVAGAGRAAWQTLLVNQPDQAQRTLAEAHLATLRRCEAATEAP